MRTTEIQASPVRPRSPRVVRRRVARAQHGRAIDFVDPDGHAAVCSAAQLSSAQLLPAGFPGTWSSIAAAFIQHADDVIFVKSTYAYTETALGLEKRLS